ncbi:MAG: tetratricopeptide repeat protein [Wenzhouxiangella sp.]
MLSTQAGRPRLELIETIERGDFAQAEQLLASARVQIGPGGSNDSVLLDHLRAFQSTDPEMSTILERWLDQDPESIMAQLAMGTHHRHLGASYRGTDGARHVTDRQREQFLDGASRAAGYFYRVRELDPENSVVQMFLANLPDSVRGPEINWDVVLDEYAPLSESAWFQVLFRSQAKYGGSIARTQALLERMEPRIAENPALAQLRGFDHYALADRLRTRGEFSAALAQVEIALEHGDHPEYHYMHGLLLGAVGRDQEALAVVERALEFHPEYVKLLRERARVWAAGGRHKEAIELLSQAIRYDPLESDIMRQKAGYLYYRDHPRAAFEALDDALVFGADQGRVWTYRAQIHFELGEYENARDAALRAIEVNPQRSRGRLRLLMAYNKLYDCGNLVAEAQRYIAGCRINRDCPEANVEWARDIEKTAAGHPACRDT